MVIKMSNTAITNTVVLGLGRSEPKEEKSLLKEVNGGFKKISTRRNSLWNFAS
jgi:hypothetical protein